MNKCIQCTRCVRACEEVQGRFVLGLAGRGRDRQIVAGTGTTMLDARCESCGACVAHCPTGALDNKMSVGLGKPDRVVTTTCGYCGVGCRFDLHVKDGEIIRVVSNPNAAVNAMELCVKGRYGYDFVHHPDRLTMPRVRRYLLEGTPRPEGRGDWVETDWETALDLVAEKLVRIKRESGADAIGLLSSAKCTNEENYLAQKFARQVIGTHNVDHCARLCHASTVAGLAMSFGSGAMSNTFDDICGEAQAILIIGSNTTEQHPVFGARIRQAVLKRGVKLVVADPRRIDITEFATLHLRHRPGTDVALINGLMHIMLKNGWQDQAFIDGRCEGFEDFKATVEAYTPESVATTTGVSVEDLHKAAELLGVEQADGGDLGDGHHPAHHGRAQRALPGQSADAPRQHGRARRRGQSTARPEQRAGRLRHGRAAERVPRLPERDRRSGPRRSLRRHGSSRATARPRPCSGMRRA